MEKERLVKCPRCNKDFYFSTHAISVHGKDVVVCGRCGTEELQVSKVMWVLPLIIRREFKFLKSLADKKGKTNERK